MKKRIFFFLISIILSSAVCFLQAKKQKPLEPSYAWNVSPELGNRIPATIDTLYQNYSLVFIPQEVSNAYAATGNYCAEGYNMLYMQRKPYSEFFFNDAIQPWIPTQDKIKFYNTRIPLTLLSYNFGGGKEDAQERFRTIFSANANSRVQVGAMVDYIYSKGSYNYQAAKNLNWGFSGSYTGERYEFQGSFTHFNLLDKENGGITDDLYITDPAVVQGGNTSINAKEIPTNLTNAFNRTRGTELWINNRYKMGFWKEEVVNDTTVKRTLVPVTSLIWTLQYNDGIHKFRNLNATENLSFWQNTYLNPYMTEDVQKYWSLKNTFGIALLEGFNKYAKLGLTAFLTHQIRNYNLSSFEDIYGDALSPIPQSLNETMRAETQNLLWVGAQINKSQGRTINYNIIGQIGLIGPSAGEIKIKGNGIVKIPLLGDSIEVAVSGHFTNLSAPWLMQHYWSNHFIWENSFEKTRSLRLGGHITLPWTGTTLGVDIENVQNQLYFNSLGLPAQEGKVLQVFAASLTQNFHFGAFHWDNSITYQTSSNESVIPLPKLTVNSNIYVLFRIATLRVQFGANCDYFTRYHAVNFSPATMTFYNQGDTMIGNYPFISAYLNFKLSRTKFYIMMSHLNQGMTGSGYFSMPHYPMNPRRLQLGLSIDFAN